MVERVLSSKRLLTFEHIVSREERVEAALEFAGSHLAERGEEDTQVIIQYTSVSRIRIPLNPDPAKNFNPDPTTEESGSGSKLFLNAI